MIDGSPISDIDRAAVGLAASGRGKNIKQLCQVVMSDFGSLAEEINRVSKNEGGVIGLSLSELDFQRDRILSLNRKGIGVLGFGDLLYPELLKHIYDPPLVLYYRGVLGAELLARPMVAIVGARNSDRYGHDCAIEFSTKLSALGVCIVSGLASGIDTIAHRGAIDGMNGGTIAVLGNGLDSIYPRSNERLAREIIDTGGIILSEYSPESPAYPANFLERNRIIAGLSLGVLVIQAAKRSGSLVTARLALENGREVMAVPGSIFDSRCEGTNSLIRKGAVLISSIDDIIETLPVLAPLKSENLAARAQQNDALDPLSKQVLQLLGDQGTLAIEAIAMQLNLSFEEFSLKLTELELEGFVLRTPGNYVSLPSKIT